MSSDENTDLFLCCTWKIIINQSKAELSNGKAAKRNPYGLHFFTFFSPPDESSCPHYSSLCPQLCSSTSLLFLTASIETPELLVSLLPFLRTNYPSAWHSDAFQKFHRYIPSYVHAGQTHIQGKLGP